MLGNSWNLCALFKEDQSSFRMWNTHGRNLTLTSRVCSRLCAKTVVAAMLNQASAQDWKKKELLETGKQSEHQKARLIAMPNNNLTKTYAYVDTVFL